MFLNKVNNTVVDRAIRYTAIAWILLAIAFGIYYYFDRYSQSSTPIVDKEIQHITQAIEKDPSDLEARVAISLYLLEKNMPDEAIKQGEAVLKVDPDHQGALFVTGKAYLAKKQDDKAVEYFTKLVNFNKESEYANLNRNLGAIRYDLGSIYLKRKDFSKAEEEFIGALIVDRADADAYYGLGQALMGQAKYELAVEAFKGATRLDPEYAPFFQSLKEAYDKNGKKDEAAFAGAMLLTLQGNHSKAIEELLKVIQILPSYSDAYRALGMSYEKSGKKSEAIDAYKKALELDPTDRAARQNLGRLTTTSPG